MTSAALMMFGAAPQVAPPGPELLTNTGFEGTYSGLCPGWAVDAFSGGAYTASRDPAGRSGSAQKIQITAFPAGAGVIMKQYLPYTVGRVYEMSVWLKSTDGIKVSFCCQNEDEFYHEGLMAWVTVGTAWQQVFARGGYEIGTQLRICFSFKSVGSLWIDDISFKDITDKVMSTPMPAPITVPNRMFALHVNKVGTHNTWPAIGQGMIRFWDTGTEWEDIETSQNTFDWTRFDFIKNYIIANNPATEVIFCLANAPLWAAASRTANPNSITDWRDFANKSAVRHNNFVKYWEIWNEHDYTGFWTGTRAQMFALTQAANEEIKAVNAANQILSPNITTAGLEDLDEFLELGGGAYVDIISVHNYLLQTREPEHLIQFWEAVKLILSRRGVSTKPIWNTEGTTAAGTSAQEVAEVARSYLLHAAHGIGTFTWYIWDSSDTWDAHLSSGADYSGITAAGQAYIQVGNWIKDAIICRKTVHGTVWILELQRTGGYFGLVVWNTAGTSTFHLPSGWGLINKRDLAGVTTALSGATSVTIGVAPILLQNT